MISATNNETAKSSDRRNFNCLVHVLWCDCAVSAAVPLLPLGSQAQKPKRLVLMYKVEYQCLSNQGQRFVG